MRKLRVKVCDETKVIGDLTLKFNNNQELEETVKNYLDENTDYTVFIFDPKTGKQLHCYRNIQAGQPRFRDEAEDFFDFFSSGDDKQCKKPNCQKKR